MRKRRILLICGIGVVLALIAFLAYRPTSEPSYNGHRLSYWVELLGKRPVGASPNTELAKATNAIDHIGVAALPFLVQWIQFDPPRWRRILAYQLARTPFPPTQKLARRIIDPTLPAGAEIAFGVLGPRAMPAFDDLCRLMNGPNSPNIAIPAAMVLACLGTNALPPLLTALTNAHHPAHPVALNAIGRIPSLGQAAHQVVPVVVSCLNPTNNSTVHILAITILGNLKTAPEISVPALAACLKNPDPGVRSHAANILGAFGSQASAAIPALTNALADPDLIVHNQVANALNRIDPRSFASPYGR